MTRILICDDAVSVHESLKAYFSYDNIQCDSVYCGEDVLLQLKKQQYQLIILDIMLPKQSGTDICKAIRQESTIPIIMLSARSEEIDRILGLELGADDYIVKPFSPREVVLKAKNILKRIEYSKQEKNENNEKVIVNKEGYCIMIENNKMDFTPKETELFVFLWKHQEKVLSRDHILNQVWGYDYFGDTRVVDTLIKRIRKKISMYPFIKIESIYGRGYKFIYEKKI